MNKSPDAFRTISEVADFLETPAHVLRFWESRFPQIRPVKRAGGRRYYRPADVALLTGIKRLLHDEGMTIRGVQKILREQGVRHVSGMTDDGAEAEDDDALASALAQATGTPEPAASLPPAEAESAQIIALQAALRDPAEAEAEAEPEADSGTAWPDDTTADEGEDDIDMPDEAPAVVAAPPPPATTDPVVADLFARPSPPAPAPPETEAPVTEAPMAVWAEESDDTQGADETKPQAPPAPALKITRIGAAAVPSPAPATPPPAQTPAPEAPVVSGPTLAQRLRGMSADDLTAADRQTLLKIRNQAQTLRARLSGPARTSA